MNEFRILSKQIIADHVKRIDVFAPFIARKAQPGQYALVMPEEKSLRVALPIIETNSEKQSVTFVFQEENASLRLIGERWINDTLYAVIGPLGHAQTLPAHQIIGCLGYGLGAALILPFCRAFKKHENKVIGIIGETTNKKVIFEPQMRLSCHKFSLMLQDGSSGRKGCIEDALEESITHDHLSCVYAAGPWDQLKSICLITQRNKIKTNILLPPLTIDGMGIGGCSYLRLGSQYVSVATHGPVVDAEQVDFDNLKITIQKFLTTIP